MNAETYIRIMSEIEKKNGWGKRELETLLKGFIVTTPKSENIVVGKSLHNTCANGARKNVKDIVFWGNGDTFKLISKASSENEGWMKSTKAMQAGTSVVVQVTTQQRNSDGSYAVAEALTTVQNAYIEDIFDDAKQVVIARDILQHK